MNSNSIRQELAHYILNNAGDSILAKFQSLMAKEKSHSIAAYTIEGKPLTADEMQFELEEAEKEIERGECFTTEELAKEIASWRK